MALRGVLAILGPGHYNSLAPISSSSSTSQRALLITHLPAAGFHGACRIGSSKLYDSGNLGAKWWKKRGDRRGGRCIIVKAQAGLGSAAFIAKEMERVAAKEALLLSIKDAGGLKGLSDPSANDKAKIDVNEKVLSLERLNPTPRPTTSPNLEGLWQFEWAGARSPGIIAARTFLESFPPALASINSLTLLVLDGSAKATGILKIFNVVDSTFTLVTKLTVEGPLRLREEYVEGLLGTPKVPDGTIPSPFKGLVNQVVAAIERLPDSVKDVVNGGLKLPLTGMFSRVLLISYLDEEILVARDKSGVPDVLLRLEAPATDISTNISVPEYMRS